MRLAAAEDDCGFDGDGTSTYRGIRGLGAMLTGTRGAVAAAATHDTFLEVDTRPILRTSWAR